MLYLGEVDVEVDNVLGSKNRFGGLPGVILLILLSVMVGVKVVML